MTLRGFFVTLIALFLGILAMGTEIREFYIMALCVCGLIVYSFVSLLLASFTLKVESKTSRGAVSRGENVNYILHLNGIAILPVVGYISVKSADVLTRKQSRFKHSLLIMPSFNTKRKFLFELPCSHIGAWKVGIKKLRFEDVFGLFSFPLFRTDRKKFTADLAVMPKIHIIEEAQESTSSGGYGNSSFSNAEEGELLGDSRLYRKGDSLKRINWKQSARAKTLYSRQYEMLQKPKIVIAVDSAFAAESMLDTVDIAFETAITMANYFVEELNYVEILILRSKSEAQSIVFGLKSNNDVVKMQYDFSNVAYRSVKEALQLGSLEDIHFLDADKLYFITDIPSVELISDIREMNKNDRVVRCIVPKSQVTLKDLQFEENNSFVTVIGAAKEISKKAGAVL